MSLREEEIRNHELFKSLKAWLTTGIITERNFEEIEKVIFYFVEQERQAKKELLKALKEIKKGYEEKWCVNWIKYKQLINKQTEKK